MEWIVLLGLALLALLALPVIALNSISALKRRIAAMERELVRLRAAVSAASVAARPQAAGSQAASTASALLLDETAGQRLQTPSGVPSVAPLGAPLDVPSSLAASQAGQAARTEASAPPDHSAPLADQVAAQHPPVQPPAPPPTPPAAPRAYSFGERAGRAVKEWFTSGNVPVKVGMLVLLAGVAALLKYASDQGWLNAPIELRLAGIAAFALAGLVFGWRQRSVRREFALAVQGGAIGVLLLTVFAAAKLYALIPIPAAFAASVVLVAGLGVLAVLQDAIALAVLGLLAGFLAPIWLSDGSGNHVALFSWYALLNAAIFAIAWMRAWRVLNLLGFVFTWGIATAWGVLKYQPEKFWSTEPFLLLFFAFYLLLPILYARRRSAEQGDRIDSWLLFGTPLVAFGLQAGLLVTGNQDASRLQLAFCALGLAAIYAALGFGLRRMGERGDARGADEGRYAALVPAYALLGVGFATLAVPLAFSARVTASVFALEGAAMLWLGLRQDRRLAQWAGLGLQLAAACAFAIGIGDVGGYLLGHGAWAVAQEGQRAIANANFMGALVIAVAGFASAWALNAAGRFQWALGCYSWALLWWTGNALHEVQRFVPFASRADVLLAFAALTGWLAAEVQRRRPALALPWTTFGAMLVAIALAYFQTHAHRQPFGGDGGWAWGLFLVLGLRSLLCLAAGASRPEGNPDTTRATAWVQAAWWLVWPTVLTLTAAHVAERFALGDGWQWSLAILPWLVMALLALQRWPWLAWPLGPRFEVAKVPLTATFIGVLALWWIAALTSAGASAPLPWVAILNPLDLTQLAVLVVIARWLWSPYAPEWAARWRIIALAAGAFLAVTVLTLRAVHHWGGVEWGIDMSDASLTQTSLTVVWSMAGVAGWIIGSRRGQRALWLAGAVLMGVVLVKLVLVDREHLGNLLGIGSFIAFGLLCTLVGYIAPAPPRQALAEKPE